VSKIKEIKNSLAKEMNSMRQKVQAGFWGGERCEYCGGPIVEKKAT